MLISPLVPEWASEGVSWCKGPQGYGGPGDPQAEGPSTGNSGWFARTAVRCGEVNSWALAGKHGHSLISFFFFLAVGTGAGN